MHACWYSMNYFWQSHFNLTKLVQNEQENQMWITMCSGITKTFTLQWVRCWVSNKERKWQRGCSLFWRFVPSLCSQSVVSRWRSSLAPVVLHIAARWMWFFGHCLLSPIACRSFWCCNICLLSTSCSNGFNHINAERSLKNYFGWYKWINQEV